MRGEPPPSIARHSVAGGQPAGWKRAAQPRPAMIAPAVTSRLYPYDKPFCSRQKHAGGAARAKIVLDLPRGRRYTKAS